MLALCGVFHVAERLGISADDLAIVLGALGTIATEVRHRYVIARNAK